MSRERTLEQRQLEDQMLQALLDAKEATCLEVADDVWQFLTGDHPSRYASLPARFYGFDLRRGNALALPLETGAWRVVDFYGRQLARSVPSAQTVLQSVDKLLGDMAQSYSEDDQPKIQVACAARAAVWALAREYGVEL